MAEKGSDAPAGLKPIPGTERKHGEPHYKKPRLPDKALIREYYRVLAPYLLDHAGERPLNLLRCTAGHCFYQRNRRHPDSGGAFDQTAVRFVAVAQKNGRTEEYLWIADETGVADCVERDGVEFHGWGSRVADVERPDRIAFDLDPGEGVGFDSVREAALTLGRALEAIGLESFPLLSGGKGVHVVLPIEPERGWDEVREFTRRVAGALAEADPSRFTISLPKAERKGRIFLDWLRNQRTATAILPWSLRARVGAPVAAPVTWDELREVPGPAAFNLMDAGELIRRAKSRALKAWGRARQSLPEVG
jgi:bifunctional non-homologous end joining protein LigD